MLANLPFSIRAISVIIIAILSVYIGFIAIEIEQRETAYKMLGYYNILLLLGCFTWSFLPKSFDRSENHPSKANVETKEIESNQIKAWPINHILDRKNWIIILLSALVAVFLYTREGGSFKIVFDEPAIAITAKNLYEKGAPTISETSLQESATYETIDKRPLLHPSLIALTHHLFGYRLENIFYLNLFFTFAFLLILAVLLRQLMDSRAAYFGLALSACLPLLSQNASSGALEILNLLLIVTTILLGIRFYQVPSDKGQDRLLLASALLAHTRYESILIALPVSIILVMIWIRIKKPILTPVTIFLPIFFITLAWQQSYVAANPESYQYRSDGYGNFSWHYISTNLKAAYNFFFIPSKYLAGAPFVGFLGVAAALTGSFLIGMRYKSILGQRVDRQAAIIFTSFFLAHAFLILCFYFGNIDDIVVSRLALPFFTVLIIAASLLLSHLYSLGVPFLRVSITLYLLASGVYALQSFSTALYSRNNKLLLDAHWLIEHARYHANKNALFISNYARIYEVEGYNNISVGRAAFVLPKIKQHLDLGTYSEIFLVQNGYLDPADKKAGIQWLPINTLGPSVTLEPVAQIQAKTYNICRISRVVSIDENRLAEEFNLGTPDERHAIRFFNVSMEEYYDWQVGLP